MLEQQLLAIQREKRGRIRESLDQVFIMFACCQGAGRATKAARGFTLVEVMIAMVVLALVIEGVVEAYIFSARRAEWNGRSLAAESLASQGTEQARAARWDPQAWPKVDELPPTNFTVVETLDIPVLGQPIYATNIIRITQASANPPLRQIRTDCVWNFMGVRLFTNTIVTLRAPDQ